MLYVYRHNASNGARELVEGILMGGTLARRTKGQALRRLQPGDAVICWGDNFAVPAGVQIRTLNNQPILRKFAEARRLADKGVATVQVSQTRPAAAQGRPAVPAVRPAYSLEAYRGLNELSEAQVLQLQRQIQLYLATPLPPGQPAIPAEIWLPRRNNHIGGADLLEDLREGDYYSKKEDIVEEYRLHMFQGKSIRAGKKVQRPTRPDGRTPAHQWIRSFDAGWVIQYDGFKSTKPMRTLAAAAVKALDLDFGAVDLGKKRDGSFIVLEVNRAPGLEGGTVEAYARHIRAWFTGQNQQQEEGE
jgi:hypothetical protein